MKFARGQKYFWPFFIFRKFIIFERLILKIPYDFRMQNEFSWRNDLIYMKDNQRCTSDLKKIKRYGGFEKY